MKMIWEQVKYICESNEELHNLNEALAEQIKELRESNSQLATAAIMKPEWETLLDLLQSDIEWQEIHNPSGERMKLKIAAYRALRPKVASL